ncbi:hypothetical protein JXA12_01035 [Candidatus Woesearchaeota archaeon]|nr:hypothetical protein [Candidatus Woesearchaeota archaeon]
MRGGTLIFVNSTRVPNHALKEMKLICQKDMREASLFPTEAQGEIHRYIENLRPRNVLIVGGDGSENEALRPAIQYGYRLGIIPHGTGNDHAAALGFDNRFKHIIKRGNERDTKEYLWPFIMTTHGNDAYLKRVDVGRFRVNDGEEHYFANSIGTGYFAEVNHAAWAYNGKQKPYLRIALQQRRRHAKRGPSRFELTTTDYRATRKENVEATNLDFLIGNQFGNGKRLNPQGRIDDGEAELFMLDNATRVSFWPNMVYVLAGTERHLENEHLDYRRGVRGLEAVFEEPQVLQYDGEIMTGVEKLTVELLPWAITMVTNERS